MYNLNSLHYCLDDGVHFNEWGDSDEVVLLKTKREDLAAKKEMLYLAKDSAPFLQAICEKAGLTAAPGDSTNNRNLTTNIADIQDFIKQHVDNSSVFIGSNLPSKKVLSAIKEYAAGLDQGQVLVYVDTTLFGSGKEGFLITREKIYTKPSMGKAQIISFGDFKNAYLKNESFAYVYIDDVKVITAPSNLREFVESLLKLSLFSLTQAKADSP